ncbi:inosine/guanosine kinase, partial [Salmonella enterica subsp. enterica serovar Hadar]|nr:inosine/guanosine kinase [Salmonella enterica subsp. enterica serovar Hadar]
MKRHRPSRAAGGMCYHAALRYSSVSTIMKFPGKRKSKHYFPVNARDP